jgi:hypothetical protein
MEQPLFDSQGVAHYPTTISPQEMERAQRERSEKAFAAIERRKEREAAREAEREKAEHDQGVAELEAYQDKARAAWLSNGGTAADFSAAWPKLREAYLLERTGEALTRRERKVEEMMARMRAHPRYQGLR